MDSIGITALTRLAGLKQEMRAIANNIANVSTTGFRKEAVVFSEFITQGHPDQDSLSMATAKARYTNVSQGALTLTQNPLDFAIEGPGYFLIETGGGAPIFVPADAQIFVSSDGTISANGRALGQLGVYVPADPTQVPRQDGVLFRADGELLPVETPVVLQGYLENSNVSAVEEIARMIEVQHAYTSGQKFLQQEDERIRGVISTLSR